VKKKLVLIMFVASMLVVILNAQQYHYGSITKFASVAASNNGPPGLANWKTNSGHSVSSMSITIDPGSGANQLMEIDDAHFSNAATITSVTWNGSSAGITFITNCLNFSTTPTTVGTVYFLIAPAAGSHVATVNYSASVAEAGMAVKVFTNASQLAYPGYFTSVKTNESDSASSLSVVNPSTVNDLVSGLCFIGLTGSPTGNVNSPAGRIAFYYHNGGGSTMSIISTNAGTAGSVTTTFTDTEAGNFGIIGVSIKGP
jgi:hypothetical protein